MRDWARRASPVINGVLRPGKRIPLPGSVRIVEMGSLRIIAVISILFAGEQHMQRMMNVVIPLCVVARKQPIVIVLGAQVMSRIVVHFLKQMNVTISTEVCPNRFSQLGKNVGFGIVRNSVHRVEPQSIEMVFFQPIKRVVNEKVSDCPALRPIKIDRLSPRGAVAVGEKLRRIQLKIISFGPKVVVDHVKKDHETLRVGRLQKCFKSSGRPYELSGAYGRTPSYPQLRFPGKSASGMSSRAVIPKSAR